MSRSIGNISKLPSALGLSFRFPFDPLSSSASAIAAGTAATSSSSSSSSATSLLCNHETAASADFSSAPRARILLLSGVDDEALAAALLADLAAHGTRGARVSSLLTALVPFYGLATPHWLEFIYVPPRLLPSTRAMLYDGAHAAIGVYRAYDGRSLDACWIAVSAALEHLTPIISSPRAESSPDAPSFPLLIAGVVDAGVAVPTPAVRAPSANSKAYYEAILSLSTGAVSSAYDALATSFFESIVAARNPRFAPLQQHQTQQMMHQPPSPSLSRAAQQQQMSQMPPLSPRQISPPSVPRLLAEQRRRQLGNRTNTLVSSVNSLLNAHSTMDERRRLTSSASALFNLKDA